MGDYNLEEIKWKDINILDILTIPIWIITGGIIGGVTGIGAVINAYIEISKKLCYEEYHRKYK